MQPSPPTSYAGCGETLSAIDGPDPIVPGWLAVCLYCTRTHELDRNLYPRPIGREVAAGRAIYHRLGRSLDLAMAD